MVNIDKFGSIDPELDRLYTSAEEDTNAFIRSVIHKANKIKALILKNYDNMTDIHHWIPKDCYEEHFKFLHLQIESKNTALIKKLAETNIFEETDNKNFVLSYNAFKRKDIDCLKYDSSFAELIRTRELKDATAIFTAMLDSWCDDGVNIYTGITVLLNGCNQIADDHALWQFNILNRKVFIEKKTYTYKEILNILDDSEFVKALTKIVKRGNTEDFTYIFGRYPDYNNVDKMMHDYDMYTAKINKLEEDRNKHMQDVYNAYTMIESIDKEIKAKKSTSPISIKYEDLRDLNENLKTNGYTPKITVAKAEGNQMLFKDGRTITVEALIDALMQGKYYLTNISKIRTNLEHTIHSYNNSLKKDIKNLERQKETILEEKTNLKKKIENDFDNKIHDLKLKRDKALTKKY